KIVETKDNNIFLELPNHSYVAAFGDNTVGPWAGPETWQSFTLLPTKNNKYFLESSHKTYLSINLKTKMLDLSNNKSDSETFEFLEAAATEAAVPANNHWYNLKATEDKFVYFDGN